ncbi:dihydropteroate synthase [candidate division WOR-1 bacterium DG_54_3]|uniref:Dihydropteroate synthase n=1 Tax=candidate division WOR-1 bacterium DG_54_3 TaxID=1703775 RepID=A0A0S7XQU2_UNCSA|nr:MAG: dihydropteroate synthase [candidate division WOR-1 bacterium DG_54_3]
MMGRIIEIKNLSGAEKELLSIGSHEVGVQIMAPKAVNRVLKIKGLRPTLANIIKQEMLSFGGEAATAHGSVNQSVDSTDLLVFGTLKQFQLLVGKLKLHPFGLPEMAVQIDRILGNYESIPGPIKIGHKTLDFGYRTYIMGVLNVTPDSFWDGGKFTEVEAAIARAKQMLEDGADIIDIGGESTRPGSEPVSAEEEKKRVLPVIERLANETGALISIDTTKAAVAQAALSSGASMVNDISGLHFDSEMPKVIAEHGIPVCIMHIQGIPKDMQKGPGYNDLMGEIINYLEEGVDIAVKAGILLEKIMVDPGIGFGKTVEHNLEILNRLKELKILGCPILVGASRKSVIGRILDLPVEERIEGTAATVAISIANGADMVRVHDVKEMARVVKMTDAILRTSTGSVREGR